MSQVSLKLHNVFWFCDKLHTKVSSGFANKQGMKLQRCADCASEAEHCQKAGPKKALNQPGNNLPFLPQLALFRAITFKNQTACIFITRVIIIHYISDFSFQYVIYNVIKNV